MPLIDTSYAQRHDPALVARVESLMWAGDTETLDAIAGCRCCCREHTSPNCPARLWNACRGQNSPQEETP
jgi:hypothetical protein